MLCVLLWTAGTPLSCYKGSRRVTHQNKDRLHLILSMLCKINLLKRSSACKDAVRMPLVMDRNFRFSSRLFSRFLFSFPLLLLQTDWLWKIYGNVSLPLAAGKCFVLLAVTKKHKTITLWQPYPAERKRSKSLFIILLCPFQPLLNFPVVKGRTLLFNSINGWIANRKAYFQLIKHLLRIKVDLYLLCH